jgi:hypothetical protein
LEAARASAALEIKVEERMAALEYDLKVIAAKTPAEKRQAFLAQAIAMVEGRFKASPNAPSSLVLMPVWGDWLPKVRAAFETPQEELDAILKLHMALPLPGKG